MEIYHKTERSFSAGRSQKDPERILFAWIRDCGGRGDTTYRGSARKSAQAYRLPEIAESGKAAPLWKQADEWNLLIGYNALKT